MPLKGKPILHTIEEVRNRFLESTKRENGCLLWTGQAQKWNPVTHRGGYGLSRVHPLVGDGDPVKTTAHRAAWRIFVGPLHEDEFVCHTCDVRLCVDLDHLFKDSASGNTRDMLMKNRQPRHMRKGGRLSA